MIRLIRKAVGSLACLGLLASLVYFGGGKGFGSFVLGWCVVGYLLWRAMPAVRSDFGRLLSVLPGSAGTHGGSGRRVARVRGGDL